MHLDECFAMIARLSPNAAKLAARMLRKDPAAPAEWAFALEVGLADRAQGSDPLTTDDLLLIAMDKDPKHFPAGPAAEYSAQQVQAMEFVRAVRRKALIPFRPPPPWGRSARRSSMKSMQALDGKKR